MKQACSFLYVLVVAHLIFPARADAASTYDLSGLKYRAIGPAITGGRVTSVVGSDLDPSLYYVGGAAGGVFKSVDGGSVWAPVSDGVDIAAIGAIAIAPHDVDDVWVGTGESNPRNDVQAGDGIWHSTDGGKTWKHLGLDDSGSISNILIDPRDPRRVVVSVLGQVFRDSTTRGIYVTDDRGAHWRRALYVGPSSGASDVTRVPDRPDTLFAGMYEFRRTPWRLTSGGPLGGVYRSDDDGATWRKLIGRGLPSGLTGRIGLSAGARGRVYAMIQSADGDLWRSDDGGADWRLMPHSPLIGARPFYFSTVTVDPADVDRLLVGGLYLARSVDGGKTFEKTAADAGYDFHRSWWSADGRRVAVAQDNGASLSADGGARWREPYDLPFAQVYHVGLDDALPNYHACIGLQDNNAFCGLTNSYSGVGVLDQDWTNVAYGDGMWSVYDPRDPQLVWSTSVATGTGQVYLWNSRTLQSPDVSPDAEQSGSVAAIDLRHRFNWDAPIAFTEDGKALVGGEAVFESADRGQHWTIISPDLTRDEHKHQVASGGPIRTDQTGAETADTILYLATSTLDGGLIWAGTDDGLIWLTRDGGAHWKNVTPRTAPTWGLVSGLESGRFRAGTLFAAFDDHMLGDDRPHLYATDDYGATWRSVSGDLPSSSYARTIRQDPVVPSLLYAGTGRGVFASWDSGAHWQSLRLNMPAVPVFDLEIQPRADDLVVGTHGRGLFVFDDLHALQQIANVSQRDVTLFSPRDAYRWFQWPPMNTYPGLPANLFQGTNAKYGALLTYWLPRESRTPVTIDILDVAGHVVRHLRGKDVPHAAGMNRAAWDLAEDAPVKWLGTFEDDQGPASGAEVEPGSYVARLRVGGVAREQRVNVRFDPIDSTTMAQAIARHDLLAEVYRELGGVDSMLNAIDRRLKSASPSVRVRLIAFEDRIAAHPRNVEDPSGPEGLRNRLVDLALRLTGTSLTGPNQPQIEEAGKLKREFATAVADYEALRIGPPGNAPPRM